MRYRSLNFSPLSLAWLLLPGSAGFQSVAAQPAAAAGPNAAGIYSCVDARGRKLTSDRPIAECSDREQRELNPSGTTRRHIEPTYTAREQADRDLAQRENTEREQRLIEGRRREHALLMRYPNAATHQRAREEALAQIDDMMQAARKRLDEWSPQRGHVEEALQLYDQDGNKAPGSQRSQVDHNLQRFALHKRFLGAQEDEKKQVNARFDEEGARLRPLWSANGAGAAR